MRVSILILVFSILSIFLIKGQLYITQVQNFSVPPQEMITKDSVTVYVNAIMYYKVLSNAIMYWKVFVFVQNIL